MTNKNNLEYKSFQDEFCKDKNNIRVSYCKDYGTEKCIKTCYYAKQIKLKNGRDD